MPYPNNFFDAIYHVDAFYFWNPERMRETCREFFRILKPSGILVCGMELNRLVFKIFSF
jgi:ubiquinone/menaquinone biosynthesis C-methylase UbiE